jgi:hypothetical protein
MRLFGKHHQKKPWPTEAEITQIRERVRTMRLQLGRRDVELADVFALIGEDERLAVAAARETRRQDAPRLWPDEIPANPATQEFDSKVTYGDWELIRRPGPFTLR